MTTKSGSSEAEAMPDSPRRFTWAGLRSILDLVTSTDFMARLAFLVSVSSAVFTYQQASSAEEANDRDRQAQASQVFIVTVDPLAENSEFAIVNRNPHPINNTYYTFRVGDQVNGAPIHVGPLPGCSSVPLTPNGEQNKQAGFEPVSLFFSDQVGIFWRRDYGQGLTQLPRGRAVPSSSTIAVSFTPLEDCP